MHFLLEKKKKVEIGVRCGGRNEDEIAVALRHTELYLDGLFGVLAFWSFYMDTLYQKRGQGVLFEMEVPETSLLTLVLSSTLWLGLVEL